MILDAVKLRLSISDGVGGLGRLSILLTYLLTLAQNKTPQTRLSRGTYVDQPSPKCCSIRSIGEGLVLVNGTLVL